MHSFLLNLISKLFNFLRLATFILDMMITMKPWIHLYITAFQDVMMTSIFNCSSISMLNTLFFQNLNPYWDSMKSLHIISCTSVSQIYKDFWLNQYVGGTAMILWIQILVLFYSSVRIMVFALWKLYQCADRKKHTYLTRVFWRVLIR